MLEYADRVIRVVSKIVLGVLIVMGFVMLGVSWAHIFCRYALNSSLSWSEEILKILVVWFCLLSATFISVRREHVSIVVFKQRFPKAMEKCADMAVSFLTFLSAAIMFYIGLRLANWAGMRKSPALRIPYSYMYAAIYVGFGLMALYELRNLLADIFAPNSPPAMVDSAPPSEALVRGAEPDNARPSV